VKNTCANGGRAKDFFEILFSLTGSLWVQKESVNVSIIFGRSRVERLDLWLLVLNIIGVLITRGKTQQRGALDGVKVL
jgi:hypothetical protein